jgi:hypothetical protein
MNEFGKVNIEKDDRHALLKGYKSFCAGCKKIVEQAHVVDDKRYCTVQCFIKHKPMVLVGDETKLNRIAADLADNRCSGRGSRKKS